LRLLDTKLFDQSKFIEFSCQVKKYMSWDPYIVDRLIEVGSRRVTRFFLLRMD
jgi:hypothetical protein